MVNGWKLTAIIFMVLFILSTGLLVYSYQVGTEIIENEQYCAFTVCSEYPTYYYDTESHLCYCVIDGMTGKQEYIK